MKKSFAAVMILLTTTTAMAQEKLVARTGQAKIYSHTVAEDISAVNNTVTGLINTKSGELAIAVPVQGFQFEKSLMQEHFNQPNFMDSKQFPRISLKGRISNLTAVNFAKEGNYEVTVEGDLTIKGVSKPVREVAHISVQGGKVTVHCKFVVKDIGSFGVGKPMGKKKNNVADDIEVTYEAKYDVEG